MNRLPPVPRSGEVRRNGVQSSVPRMQQEERRPEAVLDPPPRDRGHLEMSRKMNKEGDKMDVDG